MWCQLKIAQNDGEALEVQGGILKENDYVLYILKIADFEITHTVFLNKVKQPFQGNTFKFRVISLTD